MNALGKSYLEPPSVKSCIPQKFTSTLYHTFWQGGGWGGGGVLPFILDRCLPQRTCKMTSYMAHIWEYPLPPKVLDI